MRAERVEIGNATLYLGDCREILPTLPKVDAVITDPPYGIGESSNRNKTRGKRFGSSNSLSGYVVPPTDYGEYHWDKKIDDELLGLVLNAGEKKIIFGGNFYPLPPTNCWLIWDKQNTGDFADGELAWTNLKKAVRIHHQMWNGMIRAGEERGESRVHPTQKPIALMRWCIRHAGNPECIVDPFMGSGTTGAAAVGMKLKFIGIEKDKRYFDIACKRIEDAQRQESLFRGVA